MMINMLSLFCQILIGFASGIAVGGGFIALLTMLKIIPRLLQLSKNSNNSRIFIFPIIIGTLFGTYLSFTHNQYNFPLIILVLFGIMQGIFTGMLAASLAEVLNVFPILSRRIRLERHIKTLIMAVVFGKMFGSLFQWLVLVKF